MELTPEEIVELRQKLKLSQAEFGVALGGVSQVVVCRWERGHVRPRTMGQAALVRLWNATMGQRRQTREKARR